MANSGNNRGHDLNRKNAIAPKEVQYNLNQINCHISSDYFKYSHIRGKKRNHIA